MTKKMSVENNSSGPSGPGLQHDTVLWTSKDVAGVMHLNLEYFRNKYRNDQFLGFPRPIKPGKQRLWFRDEVLSWLEGQREEVGATELNDA